MSRFDNSAFEFSDFHTRESISDLDYREIGFKDWRWMQLNCIVSIARLCY